MKALDIVTAALVIIGALNWGLVGAANFNLVAALFGQSVLAAIVYILVGVSGVYHIWRWMAMQRPVLATA